MNQLTIQENKALEALPVSLKEFVKRRIEKPFKNLGLNDQKQQCRDIISKAHFDSGDKGGCTAEVLAAQTISLLDELNSRFGGLTLSEVKEAFKIGIRGESGPFFGLCAKTYHQFLKHYYDKSERTSAMKEYLKLVESESIKKSEKPIHVKFQETTEICLKAFDEYKATKVLPFTAFAFYDHLWKELGVIKLTQEVKEKIRIETEQEYIIELKQSKVRGQIKQSEYENIVANLGGDQNRTFINMVKKKALAFYWDSIISSGKDLKDLI